MKDIFINIKNKTRQVAISNEVLGIIGENCQGNLVIDFAGDFIDGVGWLEIQCGDTKGYVILTKDSTNKTYSLPIKSCLLTKAGEVKLQIRVTQNKVTDEVPIFKSDIFKLLVLDSINAVEEIPETYPEWIDIATAKIEALDSKVDELDEDLQSEISNRQTADETLQGNITAEAEARQSADDTLQSNINSKVDKVAGKDLSTNDFTDDYKTQVNNNTTARHSHDNKTVLDETTASYTTEEKTKLAGLSNYDDTEVKASITALQNGKVDKENGKGLSTNDFTNAEKTKLSGIEAGAEKNVQSDWMQTDTTADDYIKNKPNIPAGTTLYDTTGQNTDGSMTQKATTDALNGKVNKQVEKNGFTAEIDVLESGGQIDFTCYTDDETNYFEISPAYTRALKPIYIGGGTEQKDKATTLNEVYPVGAIYLSVDKTNSPANLFGGTWEELPEGYALWTTTTDETGGSTISAGLPNITGRADLSSGKWDTIELEGAFYTDENKHNKGGHSGSSYVRYGYYVKLDASRSSSIYGNSTTVQPPAIKVFAWKRIQ